MSLGLIGVDQILFEPFLLCDWAPKSDPKHKLEPTNQQQQQPSIRALVARARAQQGKSALYAPFATLCARRREIEPPLACETRCVILRTNFERRAQKSNELKVAKNFASLVDSTRLDSNIYIYICVRVF